MWDGILIRSRSRQRQLLITNFPCRCYWHSCPDQQRRRWRIEHSSAHEPVNVPLYKQSSHPIVGWKLKMSLIDSSAQVWHSTAAEHGTLGLTWYRRSLPPYKYLWRRHLMRSAFCLAELCYMSLWHWVQYRSTVYSDLRCIVCIVHWLRWN